MDFEHKVHTHSQRTGDFRKGGKYMNKLITKILGVAIGMSMAAGVGIGLAVKANNNAFQKAEAGSATTSPVPNAANTGSASTSYITTAISYTYETVTYYVNQVNPSTLQLKCNQGGTSSTSDGNFSMYNSTQMSGAIKSIAIAFNGSVNVNYWQMSVGSSAITSNVSYNTDLAGSLDSATNTITWSYSVSSNYRYFRLCVAKNGGTVKMTNMTITYDDGSSTPEMSAPASLLVKNAETNTLGVTYSSFTSGTTINAVSDNTSIATVTSSVVTSGTSGTANFTVTGKSVGKTKVTLSSTGASSVDVDIYVYNEQEFTLITKTSKIVDGGHYLISRTGSNQIMSLTQNSSDRGSTTATPAGSSDYSTLTTCNSDAAVIVISAGTGAYDGYYTLYDPAVETQYGIGGFLYYSSGLKTYHEDTPSANNNRYWSISFTDNHVVFASKADSTYSIQFNSSTSAFKTYNSNQTKVDLYLLSSEVTVDVDLTSITASNASVQNGSSITFTGNYLPVNATESIVATLGDDSLATLGEIIMNNGTFSLHITGEATGSTSLSFAGADGHGSANVTLTITAYVATHNKVTSTSGLYNGMKVILGNSTDGLVGGPHAGGNNVPAVAGSFGDSGATLSDASGNAYEYTMWYLTIADSDENSVSGWAFYGNGHYLECVTANQNYWKQSLQLSSLCLFEISFTDGDASIVCADTHVSHKYLKVNSSANVISAYDSAGAAVNLYVASASSDANIAAGFEDFFLMMDVNLTSHGYCTSKGWYSYAKAAWNNDLNETRRGYVSADGKARLAAWAAANDDEYDLGNGTLSNKTTVNILGNNSNNIIIVTVIISVIGLTTLGAFFLLRKKKEVK